MPQDSEPNKKPLAIIVAILTILLCIVCAVFGYVGYGYAKDRDIDFDDMIEVGDREDAPQVEGESVQKGKVTRITDGDTLKMEINGEEKVIRLLGIDAPEKGSECFNEESTEKLKELTLNKEFIYEYDNVQGKTDRYGRLLLHLWALDDGRKGEFINEKLVREGYASVYTDQGSTYLLRLHEAQQTARAQGLGIWSSTCKL